MLLFDGGRAPNARRVRIYLAEKGLTVPLSPIDINALEQKSAQFSAMNPLQRIPVLQLDDGSFLSETIAICRYFEELHPEPPLFGEGALGKANVEMWQRRLELALFLPIANVFRHGHPAMAHMEVPQIADFAEANKPKVMEALTWIDASLGSKQFICGDHFSVADITALVALDFMKPAKLSIPPGLTQLVAWYERMKSRPSAMA